MSIKTPQKRRETLAKHQKQAVSLLKEATPREHVA